MYGGQHSIDDLLDNATLSRISSMRVQNDQTGQASSSGIASSTPAAVLCTVCNGTGWKSKFTKCSRCA
eukprot:5487695-Karenia_brevis.AAC.1